MGIEKPDAYPAEGDDEPSLAAAVQQFEDIQLVAQEKRVQLIRLRGRELAREEYETEQAVSHVYTWAQVDHDEAFRLARLGRQIPDIGRMTETPNSPGLPLFYSGKINGVHGDSEAGKSWLLQFVSVQEIRALRHVLYIDFEDDASGVYRRLLDLGASEGEIRDFFHYVNPQGKLTVFEKLTYTALVNMDGDKSLAVIDGVTEAMSLESLTGRDENEVAKWHSLVTKPLATAGWGPTTIDHTPHGESRVIGSQHKRSAITGVSYSLDSIASFAGGQYGRSRLRVEKDRPGWIRSNAAPGERPQWYGDFILDCTQPGIRPAIWPWAPEEAEKGYDEQPPAEVLTEICRFVEKNPGCSGRAIRAAKQKGHRAQTVVWAIEWLVDQGCLTAEAGPRNMLKHYFDHDPE